MIPAAVRYVAARLTDGTTGVNALLASVPRPVGDTAPPAVVVRNEMDHGVTALGPIDETLLVDGPALLVSTLGVAGEAVQVLVRYAAEAGPDAARIPRDGWHTLRAAERAIRTRPAGASSAQRRLLVDGVALGPVEQVTPYAPPPGSAAEAFAPALVALVPATDLWAGAAS